MWSHPRSMRRSIIRSLRPRAMSCERETTPCWRSASTEITCSGAASPARNRSDPPMRWVRSDSPAGRWVRSDSPAGRWVRSDSAVGSGRAGMRLGQPRGVGRRPPGWARGPGARRAARWPEAPAPVSAAAVALVQRGVRGAPASGGGRAGGGAGRGAAEEGAHGALALVLGDEEVAGRRHLRVLEHVGAAAAADRGREHELGHRPGAHARDHDLGRVPADEWPLDEVVGEAQGIGEPVLDAVDDELLELRALDVRPRELAAAAGVLARAGEGDRLEAVQRVLAGAQLEPEGATGDARADPRGQVHLHAADRVYELAEAVEVHDRDLVHVDAEELLDRLDRELGAAVGIGGVDLVLADPRDRGEGVAGDGELAEDAAAGPDEHDRVRAV